MLMGRENLTSTTLRLAILACAIWGAAAHAQPVPDADEKPSELPVPAPDQQSHDEPALLSPNHPPTPGATSPAPPPDKESDAAAEPGRALFRQALTALGKVRALTFHLTTGGTGTIAAHAAKIESDIQMVRSPRSVLPGWHLHVKGTSTDAQGDVVAFDVAWLDSTIEWQDAEKKIVFERPQAEAKRGHKEVSRANLARFEDFVSTQPFKKELESDDYTIEDRAVVDGVECDVVLVRVNKGKLPIRWWLGVEDHLPRKCETIFSGSFSGTRVSQVSALVASPDNSSIPAPAMRVPVPEGFTEDRVSPAATAAPTPRPAALPSHAGPAGTTPTEPATPPAATKFAPDFDLTDATGAKVTLASLKGKVVVAEFAGTWSLGVSDARREFQALLDRYKSQPVLGLSFAVREKSRVAAIDDYHSGGYTFDLLLDADNAAKNFGVAGYPSYAIIGPEGELLKPPSPFHPTDTMALLTDEIDDALAKLSGTSRPPRTRQPEPQPQAAKDAPAQGSKPEPAKPATSPAPATAAKPAGVPAGNLKPGLRAKPTPTPKPTPKPKH